MGLESAFGRRLGAKYDLSYRFDLPSVCVAGGRMRRPARGIEVIRAVNDVLRDNECWSAQGAMRRRPWRSEGGLLVVRAADAQALVLGCPASGQAQEYLFPGATYSAVHLEGIAIDEPSAEHQRSIRHFLDAFGTSLAARVNR